MFEKAKMKKRSASALIMSVTLVALLLLIIVASSTKAITDMGLTADEKTTTKLESACLSGINRAKAKLEVSYNNNNLTILEPEVYFEGTSADATGLTPEQKAFNDETFVMGADADYYTFVSGNENDEITVKYAITEAAAWKKSPTFTSYKANIDVIAYSDKLGQVSMRQTAIIKRTTLFMYQVFFEDTLEILPGANFNLTGLIHTNNDLYLNSEATLSIYTDSITAAGDAHRGRYDKTAVNGTVKITKGDQDGSLVAMANGVDSTNSNWINLATSNWQGTLQDASLGGSRLEAPSLQSFEPGGYYDTNSDLKISVLAAGKTTSKTTYKITYNGVTSTYTSSQLGGALKEVSMYDRREYGTSKTIKVTEVNVQLLSQAIGYPEDGIIYMTRDDAVPDTDGNVYTPSSSRVVSGFKLSNASTLPSATTFVSNLPTYIKGNFNLHTSTDPAQDSWQPCAVISDAITLLSNNWSDSLSNTSQTASNTTYNTVFITGNVPTKPGQYSGGLENFPRFLENWSSKTTTIAGGFIQLFKSKYATGLWGGSYYSAPNRNWSSEERFADLTALPPGYSDLFPSTSLGITYSNWKIISKDEALLTND